MLNQNYDKEKQLKWRRINAFNTGTTNWFRKKANGTSVIPQVTDSFRRCFSVTDVIDFQTHSSMENKTAATGADLQSSYNKNGTGRTKKSSGNGSS
jgi:hypothetical protein